MKEFNPIRLSKGEFQISLNLTSLGQQSWDILRLAEQLGFPKPQFYGFQRLDVSEVWAVVVREKHDYEAVNLEDALAAWELPVEQLVKALPDRNENLLIAGRFRQRAIA
jgi:hypothetical protein